MLQTDLYSPNSYIEALNPNVTVTWKHVLYKFMKDKEGGKDGTPIL